jgi:hypothetical protein
MGVRNGYWLVGRAGRWLGGLKAVRAGARRRGGPGGLRGLGGELGRIGRAEARCTAPAPFIVRSGYNNAALSEKRVQMPAAYPRAMAQVHLRWERNV